MFPVRLFQLSLAGTALVLANAAAAPDLVLLYSVTGYESRASKRALVRTAIVAGATGSDLAGARWELRDA